MYNDRSSLLMPPNSPLEPDREESMEWFHRQQPFTEPSIQYRPLRLSH